MSENVFQEMEEIGGELSPYSGSDDEYLNKGRPGNRMGTRRILRLFSPLPFPLNLRVLSFRVCILMLSFFPIQLLVSTSWPQIFNNTAHIPRLATGTAYSNISTSFLYFTCYSMGTKSVLGYPGILGRALPSLPTGRPSH